MERDVCIKLQPRRLATDIPNRPDRYRDSEPSQIESGRAEPSGVGVRLGRVESAESRGEQ